MLRGVRSPRLSVYFFGTRFVFLQVRTIPCRVALVLPFVPPRPLPSFRSHFVSSAGLSTPSARWRVTPNAKQTFLLYIRLRDVARTFCMLYGGIVR